MSEEKNIKAFTAADIEKYWTHKLSTSEMHAMEKAAMDDPFLADAMEGYKDKAGVEADLATLRERLDKRILAVAPVVSIKKQKKFPWLKVAAAIIVVGGMGVLVQQLLFKNKNLTSIADSRSEQNQKAQPDTNNNTPVPVTSGDIQGSLQTFRADSPSRKAEERVPDNLNTITLDNNKYKDTLNLTVGVAASELEQAKEVRKDSSSGNAVARAQADKVNEKFAKRSSERPAIDDTGKFYDNKDKEAVESKAKSAEALAGIAPGRNFAADFTNRYNYRVVDAQNNPVPFANVMNIGDNVGTYTDIRGNFNLISTDSVLNVQIKSLGYLSGNYKLVPSNQFKSLTLKEDIYARREFLDSTRQLVSTSSRKDTAELEEPEVGWGYFNTYVANNIQIPDDIRKKSTLSNVELSFDVDKTGQPINIKVTKSSHCKECDEEAKRLLKEGPKWKRKGKKSKTTISIAVDQK